MPKQNLLMLRRLPQEAVSKHAQRRVQVVSRILTAFAEGCSRRRLIDKTAVTLNTGVASSTILMPKSPLLRASRSTQHHNPKMSAWVYILRCSDGSYYVGSARGDLERRLGEHQSGAFGGYTAARRPVELVFSEEFAWITDSIAAERQIKGWSRRKKEALIAAELERLPIAERRSALGVKNACTAVLRASRCGPVARSSA